MYAVCHWLRKKRLRLFPSLACCIGVAYVISIPGSIAITWTEIHFGGSKVPIRWDSTLAGAVGVTFVFVAWSAFYFGIKRYQDFEEQREALAASERLAREAQLRALRYQLQPHFLFNTLNAISTLVLDNQPKVATEMIAKLAGLLRSTLDSPDTHQVSLADEVDVAEEYLAIERLRFGTRLVVLYEIEDRARPARVPRFLLQPLIENAVRHGISKRANGGIITIKACLGAAALYIEMRNEGSEHGRSYAASSDGVGLSNTRMRLERIYGGDAEMQTANGTGGAFTVSITIPLSKSELARATPEDLA